MTTLSEHKALLNELGEDRCNSYLTQTLLVALRDVIEHLTAAPKVPDDFGLPLYSQRKQYESRIHELENTIKQLEAYNAVIKSQRNDYSTRLCELGAFPEGEQSGCRKDDTQDDGWIPWTGGDCPVRPDVVVQTKLRDGFTGGGVARMQTWAHFPQYDRCDIIAYRIAEEAPTQKENDGWIPWNGGKRPNHTKPDEMVYAKLRCGETVKRSAGNLDWRHDRHAGDIVAYRIAE